VSSKRNRIRNARRITEPTVTDQFTAIKAKFSRLAELRARINELKIIYAEYDALLTELLPLFITKTDTQFIIDRGITIGNERHQFTPHFFDPKKDMVLAKQWKSTAFETGTIE
jgi:succinyl-CoA synthetase beta subunit